MSLHSLASGSGEIRERVLRLGILSFLLPVLCPYKENAKPRRLSRKPAVMLCLCAQRLPGGLRAVLCVFSA